MQPISQLFKLLLNMDAVTQSLQKEVGASLLLYSRAFLAFLRDIKFLGDVEFIEIQTGSSGYAAFIRTFVDALPEPAVRFNHN